MRLQVYMLVSGCWGAVGVRAPLTCSGMFSTRSIPPSGDFWGLELLLTSVADIIQNTFNRGGTT